MNEFGKEISILRTKNVDADDGSKWTVNGGG